MRQTQPTLHCTCCVWLSDAQQVLFTGTLKENLTRDLTTSDTLLCSVLNSVGLVDFASVERLGQELKPADLSIGQQQLLATARVLTRQPKVTALEIVRV